MLYIHVFLNMFIFMYIHIHTYLYLYISELHAMFEVGHVGYVIQKQSNQLDCNY
jgi:hypothetical protein